MQRLTAENSETKLKYWITYAFECLCVYIIFCWLFLCSFGRDPAAVVVTTAPAAAAGGGAAAVVTL